MKIGVGRGGTPVRALNVVSAIAGFFMRAAPAHPSDLCGGLLRRAYCAPLNPHAASLAASREKRGGLSYVENPAFSLESIGRARGSSGESGGRRLRPRAFLCGVGGYSPPSAALKCCGRRSPARVGKRQGRKHGRLFSTSGHICPRGRGAASAGGRPYPAPGCPPRPSLCGGL